MSGATKAWKDPAFRATLGDDGLADVPAHPAGSVEFDDMISGIRGAGTEANQTTGCCPSNLPYTFRTCLSCYMWTCRTCWTCEC